MITEKQWEDIFNEHMKDIHHDIREYHDNFTGDDNYMNQVLCTALNDLYVEEDFLNDLNNQIKNLIQENKLKQRE